MSKNGKQLIIAVVVAAIIVAAMLLLFSCNGNGNQAQLSNTPAAVLHTFHTTAMTNSTGTKMDVSYWPKVGVNVAGLSGDTIEFEATLDNTRWYSVEAVSVVNGAKAATTTSNGLFDVAVPFAKFLRAEISNYSAGTITVMGIAKSVGATIPTDNDVTVSDITTGTVDVGKITTALPVGTNALGSVIVSSVTTGTVDVGKITTALPAGDNNMGNMDVASIAAGETHIGEVGTPSTVISITVAVSDTVYASGDLLFDTTFLTDVMRVNGGTGVVYSIIVFDPDDQGAAMELYILDTWCTWGTWNAAVAPADTCAANIICGPISVLGIDYADVGSSRVAQVAPACLVKAATGSNDLYIVGVSRGTGTYAGGYLVIHVGVMQD